MLNQTPRTLSLFHLVRDSRTESNKVLNNVNYLGARLAQW
jgi:hypothetical protein